MKALQTLGQARLGRKKKRRSNKRGDQEQAESLISEDGSVGGGDSREPELVNEDEVALNLDVASPESQKLPLPSPNPSSTDRSFEAADDPGLSEPWYEATIDPESGLEPNERRFDGSTKTTVDAEPAIKPSEAQAGLIEEEPVKSTESESKDSTTVQQFQEHSPDSAAASVRSLISPRSVRFAAALVEEKSITEVSSSPNLNAQPAQSILLNSRLQTMRHTPLENMTNAEVLDDEAPTRDDSFDDVSWGSASPEGRTSSSQSTKKGTRSSVAKFARGKRSLRKLALNADEEQGLTITDDVTSFPEKPIHKSRQDIFREAICGRKWCLIIFMTLFITMLIARSVGKSSNSSLSTSTAEERDNPVRHAAEDAIKMLRSLLRSRPKPIIISTLGGNSEGLDVVAAVFSRLGLQIPTQIDYKGFPLGSPRQNANFKRVLERTLSPEKGLMYDERTVASEFSLTDWHIGRRFVAEYINATAYAVHEAFRSEPWAILHPRAGYLLPYIRAVLGDLDTFIFVHVTKHGFHFSKKATDEFRHLCTLVRLPGYCNTDSVGNRMAFWGEVNSQVKTWATSLLDVDQYYVARGEDFANGNFECIEKLAKALKLKSDKESIDAAIAAGKSVIKTVEASDAPDDVSLPDIAQGLSEVQRILQYLGYSVEDTDSLTSCKEMEWF